MCLVCLVCFVCLVCCVCLCAFCISSWEARSKWPFASLQAAQRPHPVAPNPTAAHEVADALTLAELPELPSAAAAGAAGEGSPGGAAGGGAEGAAAEQPASGERQAGREQQEGQEEQQGEEEEPEEEPLAWLPATLAAVALRLRSLDAALLYGDPPQPAARESLPGYQFIQRPTVRGVVCGQPLGELQLRHGLGWRHTRAGQQWACRARHCCPLSGAFGPATLHPLPPACPSRTATAADRQGAVKQSFFPPLPARLLYGPRVEFTFPKAQFEVGSV